jgi:hypothetical protein
MQKKPPTNLDPPTPEVALVQLQTSLLVLLLLTRHVLRSILFHPTSKSISDGVLMEAILKDSNDRSDSSMQLLDMMMAYSKILDNIRPQIIVRAMKLGGHLGKAAKKKSRQRPP